MIDTKFAYLHLIKTVSTITFKNTAIAHLSTLFIEIKTFANIIRIIYNNLLSKFSCITILPIKDLLLEKPIIAFGVNLLVMVKVQNWVFGRINVNINIFYILSRILMSTFVTKIAA